MPVWPPLAYPAAVLLAVSLPFAAIPPVVVTGWASLTAEKVVLLLVVAAWVAQGWRALPTADEWRALLPTLVFTLLALVAALLANDYQDEAVRFCARLLVAAFGMLVALRLVGDAQRVAGLLWAVAIGGGVSALLGIGEAMRLPVLEPALGVFKVAPTSVGGELRVSATFQYATIAAMYFEMVAPLAIVLSAIARRPAVRLLGAAIAVVCTASVVLSLTRAGLLTLTLVYASLLVGALVRRAWRRLLGPCLAAAAVLLAGTTALLVRDPVFDLRLVTESDADWYGAVYTAPAALSVQANQAHRVQLEVRNAGRITWTSTGDRPFALGYRWLTADGTDVLDLPPAEVALPRDVQAGETLQLETMVVVPNLPAGSYRLDWGMLQQNVVQFYERGWADAESVVSVRRGDGGGVMPAVVPRDDEETPWVVGRLELWGAALRLTAAHPLLGVGPDNFRHLYGSQLGLEGWDERVRANNVYLEVLTDLGLLGLLAFMWTVAGPLLTLARALKVSSTPSTRYLLLGISLALVAFLLHGLLDSFLTFTPTAMLFWMLLGLAQAQKPQVSGR